MQAQQQVLDALVLADLNQALPKADALDTFALSGELDALYSAYAGSLERSALHARTHGSYRLTVLLIKDTLALGSTASQFTC